MKITICDVCKKQDNKITETEKYLRVTGKPELRLDVCQPHAILARAMSMTDYVRFVHKLDGFNDLDGLTDTEVKERFLR